MRQGKSERRNWRCARWALAAAMPLAFAALGCGGGIMDDLRDREFRFRDVFNHQDPMTVLDTSTNGDERARAMRKLKEPLQNGGTQAQQDKVMEVLTESATKENRPICRLAAIDSLSKMKDPRATAALIQAYSNAASFQLDVANAIRVDSLAALGKRSEPDAVTMLVKAATEPAIEPEKAAQPDLQPVGFLREKSKPSPQDVEVQKSLARDVRLAAIRALADTRSAQATEALTGLLNEKDVAIRDRAQAALEAITGKTGIKPEAKAWQEALGKK